MGLAMRFYPGGNWLDRGARGHRFLANFVCDLTQPVSLSGVENRQGAFCAQAGMLFFALALAAFFLLVPRVCPPEARSARWVRWLGACAVVSFVAVPLTPSERFGNIHSALALASGGFGILGAACAVGGLAYSHRWLALLGAFTLSLAALDGALFVAHLGDLAPPLIVPAAQKIAALLLCAWMIGVAKVALAGDLAAASHHR